MSKKHDFKLFFNNNFFPEKKDNHKYLIPLYLYSFENFKHVGRRVAVLFYTKEDFSFSHSHVYNL